MRKENRKDNRKENYKQNKKETAPLFEPEILVLRDDGGNEAELIVLDYVTYEGKTYVVLQNVDADEHDPVIIMHYKKDEYFFIGDQRVIDAVYELYMKANF